VLLGYLVIEVVRRRPTGATMAAATLLILVVYIYLKRFSFLDEAVTLPFPYLIVGLSYILFRVLHLVIDTGNGELKQRLGPLEYFNYTCGFLSFVSGPIQRYEEFKTGFAPDHGGPDRVFGFVSRVVKGFFWVLVLSGLSYEAFSSLKNAMLATTGGGVVFALTYAATALAYTMYLFFNFCGYMHVVIGIGGLFGITVPENFNRPFTAASFLDFWGRWHITLSDWFRTYLFNPFLKVLAGRFTSARAAPVIGVAAFFVTFLVMGIWHGTTAVFLIYGLIMGAGASINKIWQIWMTKRFGRKGYRAIAANPFYVYFCRGLTFSYFALGVTCLWVDMAELTGLMRSLGAAGGVLAYAAVTVASSLVMLLWDLVANVLARGSERAGQLAQNWFARNAWLAARLLLIVVVSSFFHKSPEFVYKAF
jgi:D-alanyl-lipoteichoic acid acyltransferase DltB (MBOAT superfamily)